MTPLLCEGTSKDLREISRDLEKPTWWARGRPKFWVEEQPDIHGPPEAVDGATAFT